MESLLNHGIGDNICIDVKESTRDTHVLKTIYFYLHFYLLHRMAAV
jgi:hypothetical protein